MGSTDSALQLSALHTMTDSTYPAKAAAATERRREGLALAQNLEIGFAVLLGCLLLVFGFFAIPADIPVLRGWVAGGAIFFALIVLALWMQPGANQSATYYANSPFVECKSETTLTEACPAFPGYNYRFPQVMLGPRRRFRMRDDAIP